MTREQPVFVFGSFSADEAASFQLRPLLEQRPQKDDEVLSSSAQPLDGEHLLVEGWASGNGKKAAEGTKESVIKGNSSAQTPTIPLLEETEEVAPVNHQTQNELLVQPILKESELGGVGETCHQPRQEAKMDVWKNNGVEKVEKPNGAQGTVHHIDEQEELGSDDVPAKLLPKSWAALVGVQRTAVDRGIMKGNALHAPPRAAGGAPPVASRLTEDKPAVLPRGLLNTGNSCFLNATLQALLSCPPFLHLLLFIRSRPIPQTGYPTLRAFVEFAGEFDINSAAEQKTSKGGNFEDARTSSLHTGEPFAPCMFDVVLQNFSPDQPHRSTGRPRQEDAQEFLSYVMDRMHEELLWLEGTSLGGLQAAVDDDDWETVGPKNRTALTRVHLSIKSPLSDIFGGQLCSIVKTKGNKASATVQPFLVMHLDILPDAIHSVEDALKFFAAPESLEGYKPTSGKGNEVVSASKAIKIQALPQVLLLHLMRFSYGALGSGKLHKPVRFSLDLTLGRELLASPSSAGSETRKYELVATVTHHGKDPSGGHYTADCKQNDGRWIRFDDAKVSLVGLNRVLHDQAYVLFYKRVSI
ncbi:hypothetical protein BDL97_06G067900 [Sphagnum fallax]|nr:hypothetical protein BDL97_06G067900 [Sphagnum fallax]